MKLYIPILAVLLLSGCAPRMSTTLPPWQGDTVSAQFSARVVPQAAELPLQGGLRMDAEEGTLAVILQHGRTLGHCRLEATTGTQDKTAQKSVAAQRSASMQLQCRVSDGLGASSQQLLTRVALAAFRSLYALHEQDGQSGQQGQDWRVTIGAGMTLRPLVYEDTLGTVHMTFSEVRP